MKNIKDYDRFVCAAVRNDPLRFIDIMIVTANEDVSNSIGSLLREAACVIANLMAELDIPEKHDITNQKK